MFLALKIHFQNLIIMNLISYHGIKVDNTSQFTNYKIETLLDYYQHIDRFLKLLIQQKG